MESEGMQRSSWAEMAPDVLANIFARLPLQEVLTRVPLVCKPWWLASLDPLCYVSIDLYGFRFVDRLLEQIILPRSQGRLRHIFVHYPLDRSSIYLLADSAPQLQTLHIQSDYVDDEWAAYAAPKMPHIVDLNLDACNNYHKPLHLAIEAFGKSCRHVLKLRQNRPWGWATDINNDEAFAIAQYYPSIKHLELRTNPLSEEGLKAILLCCRDLESIELGGCRHLWHIDSGFIDRCHARIKQVHWSHL